MLLADHDTELTQSQNHSQREERKRRVAIPGVVVAAVVFRRTQCAEMIPHLGNVHASRRGMQGGI